jgi:hypothetical protein
VFQRVENQKISRAHAPRPPLAACRAFAARRSSPPNFNHLPTALVTPIIVISDDAHSLSNKATFVPKALALATSGMRNKLYSHKITKHAPRNEAGSK